MDNIHGSVTINTDTWTLRTDLSGTCGSVNISIHKFPVIYGASRDPCHISHLGHSCYDLSLSGVTQVGIDPTIRYDACSLVLKTCGQQTCVNLETRGAWQAVVRSFIVGQVYFLQSANQQPITAVMELALVEGQANLNASLFFSDTCQVTNVQPLGNVDVGHHQNLTKSYLELTAVDVKPYVVVKYQERWACAEVRSIQPKEASAQISMLSIKGSISFRQQSPFHPTQLSVSLWKLRGLAGQYGIHSLPVLPRKQSPQDVCGEANTGDVWNPLSVGAGTGSGGHSSWQIGDLSGRHGTLQGREEFSAVLTDWNLPLYGNNSVIGRSVLIYKAGGEPWACSTINLEGEIVTALASFRKGVVGRMMFQQAPSDPYNDLTVYMELSHVSDNISTNHNWDIHEFPLSSESEGCAGAGGLFNPYNIPIGKHAPVTLFAPSPARYLFTDSSASLTGPQSIIGRSVVMHGPGAVPPRMACANILLHTISEGRTSLWLGPGNARGELKASQVSEFMPTVIAVDFHGLEGLAGGFHIHLLPVTEGSDRPCSNEQIRGHFNPFNVDISGSPAAGNGTDDDYEVGDISGRHGSLLGLDNKTGQFNDTNLPLSGQHSVLGRSMVIHYVNGSR